MSAVLLADVGHTVRTGSLLVAMPIAAAAGALSFFSPCVLPLVPGYLSYATGVSGADLENARRGRMVVGTLLFVLGFTAVFVSMGALFGFAGASLLTYRSVLTKVLGGLTILFGLSFMGLTIPGLQRELRIHRTPVVGYVGAPLLGALFGLGWTPCLGPTLSAVMFLSYQQSSAGRGALLTVLYCLGLGLPFVLAAVALRRALGAFAWIKRHYAWVMRIGGLMLIAVGVLLVTGLWNSLLPQVQGQINGFETVL